MNELIIASLRDEVQHLKTLLREVIDSFANVGGDMRGPCCVNLDLEQRILAVFDLGVTPNYAKHGIYVIIRCVNCGTCTDLPRVGKDGEHISSKEARGWQLYPKFYCPVCANKVEVP
jgi:hypothetical protein